MSLTTADAKYIADVIAAVNTYATAMNTFTAAAAAAAQAAMATSLANATTTWAASVNRQGE